ncbi:DoxX family protein [Frigoribacterium faeni]|uniref:Membrane protein n=1 Tax=Frigoribacterium faeni TaxID=145483 RepID=A0A7W3JG03_9MICO|nr:DoxX family protein [Frigoribacterium faeni]MBA8812095.1 putative oxidoreductase [Frigoribacterium faeni]BFF13109.1 DoxX family protein [Microbacterium flavescens]GEK83831.1 membrane protein [Frigoribacterium faeni]
MSSLPASLGLLVLRVALGVTFVAHGWQKIVLQGIPATQEGFAGMGVPLADVAAPTIAWLEIVAGIALVVGLASRVAAGLLAATSLVALFLVHAGNGFFSAEGGYEFVLVLAAAGVALVLTGPGRLAVDAVVVSWRRGRGAPSRIAQPA